MFLSFGTALFLVGLACFHRPLSGSWTYSRLWVPALTTPAARRGNGAAALVVTALVLLGLIVWDSLRPSPT